MPHDVSSRPLRVFDSDVYEPAARCDFLVDQVASLFQLIRHRSLEGRIHLEATDIRIVRHIASFGVGQERAQRPRSEGPGVTDVFGVQVGEDMALPFGAGNQHIQPSLADVGRAEVLINRPFSSRP